MCVHVTFDVFTNCEGCTRQISTTPGSIEAGEYGRTCGTWVFVRRLEVVAGAGLLWLSWCVLGGAEFFPCFFHEFAFSNSYIQSSQRRLDEGAPTASQSANRELARTYPHQVYRLVCSHLRNLASAVDQYSGRSQPASLILDPTSECNVNKFFSSFESASRILSRERHHRWTYGRGTSRHVF